MTDYFINTNPTATPNLCTMTTKFVDPDTLQIISKLSVVGEYIQFDPAGFDGKGINAEV